VTLLKAAISCEFPISNFQFPMSNEVRLNNEVLLPSRERQRAVDSPRRPVIDVSMTPVQTHSLLRLFGEQ
jgi:hypothetical protein